MLPQSFQMSRTAQAQHAKNAQGGGVVVSESGSRVPQSMDSLFLPSARTELTNWLASAYSHSTTEQTPAPGVSVCKQDSFRRMREILLRGACSHRSLIASSICRERPSADWQSLIEEYCTERLPDILRTVHSPSPVRARQKIN